MEEEDEMRNLLNRRNATLTMPRKKSFEAELKMNCILWEYSEVFDKERGRPRITVTKLWLLMQCREMKNLNVGQGLR